MAGIDDLDLPPGARNGLDGAELLGHEALEAKHQAAKRAGLFCSACDQPMDESGWEYISFRTDVREGDAVVLTARAFICNRPCCTDARATLEKTAGARRPWAPWHIFYVEAPDAPPADEDARPEATEPGSD